MKGKRMREEEEAATACKKQCTAPEGDTDDAMDEDETEHVHRNNRRRAAVKKGVTKNKRAVAH